MKVILEAQHSCTPEPRGISYYNQQIIRQLLLRNSNEYELTFFDENRERNNLQWINKYFGEFNVPIHECNSLSYKTALENELTFFKKSYNDYTCAYGDVFHFSHIAAIPDNLYGKMVVTIHDMLPVTHPEFFSDHNKLTFQLGLKRLLKMQPVIITDSFYTKNDILNNLSISEHNIYVVPLSYDEKAMCFENNTDLLKEMEIESPYLLYLGAVDIRKNIVNIVTAFELLAEQLDNIKLVIAGGESYKSDIIINRIKNSKFVSRIIITGFVNDMQKHVLYSNALAFLFPSEFEGFGLPVLEAMARGCPVITSNVSSLPEVAGDAAILVNPYDIEQLAYEMLQLIESNYLRDELKRKGLEQCKKFSWNKTAEMTEDVYKRI